MARLLGISRFKSELTKDEHGQLIASLSIVSNISSDFRKYSLPTGLADTHYNRHVLGTLILLGLKQVFNNLKVLSPTITGLNSLFEQADKVFHKVKNGNYALTDGRAKKNGERNFSAPNLVYYLLILKKPSALTREEIMELTPEVFNLDWLDEYKSNVNAISYSLFTGKDQFKELYAREIGKVKGIINILKSDGRL